MKHVEHGAKHYFVMSNDPSLDKREKGLNVILACAQFEQSIAHFHRIEEFPGGSLKTVVVQVYGESVCVING